MKIMNEKKENKTVGVVAARKLLSVYLNKAVALSAGRSKAEAKRQIGYYFDSADKKSLTGEGALKAVSEKEKALSEKAAKFALKTKLNYASDADVTGLSDATAAGVAAMTATMLLPVADGNVISAALFSFATCCAVKRIAKTVTADLSSSKTDAEKKSAKDYADIKHAQLALKLLKKEIEAPAKDKGNKMAPAVLKMAAQNGGR